MKDTEKVKLNPRKVFWECGACSHAMFHLLNHEFEHPKTDEEKASDLLAGGIAQKGQQCGMLWGSALAVGAEAYRRYEDKDIAKASAMTATQYLLESFAKRARSVNCNEIAKVDWGNKFDLAFFVAKTFLQGIIFSPCFNLMARWSPEAIQAANEGLDVKQSQGHSSVNCASEVVKKMGATDEEATMVAGFAGGLGLSGNACGALAAAIWYRMLEWSKKHPGQTPPMFKNPDAAKLLEAFNLQTGSEMMCHKICGKYFSSLEEHSDFVKSGGCANLIDGFSRLN